MEWIISNRKRELTIAVLVAVAAFGTVFLFTGALLTSVYGVKPGDPDYYIYTEPDGTPKTPYQNFLTNGCMTKLFYEGDKTVVLDTKGVDELGMLFFNPNVCFDLAKGMDGYTITKIEPYTTTGPYDIKTEQMKITLTKK